MKLGLAEKRVVVVGGSGGLGRAVLAACAAAGARCLNLDLRPPDEGPEDGFIEVDASSSDAVRAAFAKSRERLGGIDHVVYCAGITRDRVLWKLADHDWERVLAVNLSGAFYVLRAATPELRRGEGRSAVLLASINGERGKRGQANYAASKGGLIALARTAARELGHFGARVNVVAPGLIEGTAMTADLPAEALARAREEAALPRLGRPEDVAGAVLFLISDLAAHVTGQVLRVDGGQLIA
ncbi:MAG: SDR family oxidoreductase [Planctomycetota bacterium]|nr:MAG: SDR family oxidoreductase [Planctomycetota bacterium]